MSATVYIAGNTIFVIFGTADVQPWNTYWEDEKNQTEKEKEMDQKICD